MLMSVSSGDSSSTVHSEKCGNLSVTVRRGEFSFIVSAKSWLCAYLVIDDWFTSPTAAVKNL